MLHWLIIIPIISVILLFPSENRKYLRAIALLGTGLLLMFSSYLVFYYFQNKLSTETILFESTYAWFPAMNIHYHTGVDGISIFMILMTAIVTFTAVLASWNVEENAKEFFILFMLLALGAFGFFISLDLFALFFFLEIAIIPKFLMISKWGSGMKESSAMKLALMLMGGSALVLVSLLGIYYAGGKTFDLFQIGRTGIPVEAQRIFYPMMFVGFGVFTAMFPFHSWVPDGHSSAPTAASMFLSGISMKLGGYGCIRIATYLMPQAALEFNWIFIILASIGTIYGAFATVHQKDLKYINAYSSISHCSLVLLGILIMTRASMTGAVLQMFSHGIMTALFFALIGMIYARTKTRDISQMSGLLKPMPFIGTCYIIAGLCSLGLPGLSGFVAEANIFFGSFEQVNFLARIATILAVASIVITAVYILRAVGQFLLGPIRNETFSLIKDAGWNEKLLSFVMIGVIVFMGTMPFWFTGMVHDGIGAMMHNIQPLQNEVTTVSKDIIIANP
jgi:NADH-quinone oxidoreductase subunit M